MRYFFIIIVLLLIIPLQLLYLYSKNHQLGTVAGITSQEQEVENSVSIGEYHFSLFGYTSPQAEVTFNGQGIYDQTIADNAGYFTLKNRFSPFSPREACLSSKDQFGRISAPVCLASFPTQYNIVIGPVIVPPTISLDKPNYFIGDEVVLTGQSLPDADINLSMFTQTQGGSRKVESRFGNGLGNLKQEDGLSPIQPLFSNFLTRFPLLNLSSIFHIIKPVEAFSFPDLTAKTDAQGNFSLALPSSQAQNYRLFTQVDYQDEPSANSLTLSLKILPIWMIIIKFFGFIWSLLKSRLLEIVILLEIVALITYFFRAFLHPYYLSKNKTIVVYKNHLPVVEQVHPLTIIE